MLKKKLALTLVMLMLFSISYADTTTMDGAERFNIGNEEFVVDHETEGLIGALHLFDDEAIIKVGSTSEGNGSDDWVNEMKYRILEAQVHIMTDNDDDEFPLTSKYLPRLNLFEYKPDVDYFNGNNVSISLNEEDRDELELTTPTFAIAVHLEVIMKDEYEEVVEDYDNEDEDGSIKDFIEMKKEEIEEAYEEYLDDDPDPELTLEEFVEEELTNTDLFYYELEIITGWTSEEMFNEDEDWASYDDRGIQIEPVPDPDEDPEPGQGKQWKSMEPNTRGNKFGLQKKLQNMTQEEFKLWMKEMNKKGGSWKTK